MPTVAALKDGTARTVASDIGGTAAAIGWLGKRRFQRKNQT